MLNLFDDSQQMYSSPLPSSFSSSVSSTREQSVEVALEHLVRYDIKELQKLQVSDGSNEDVNKDNDDRKRVLRERLALYFSTERGFDYDQKLREKVNPTLLFYTREDRYAELCELTIEQLILRGSSRENVDNIIKEILVQALASYQDAMKGHGNPLPEEGRKQLDCLADLMFYLTYKIEENALAEQLINKSSEQLEEIFRNVAEHRARLREEFERVQGIVGNREADLIDAEEQIARHSAIRKRTTVKEIASVLVRQPIHIFSEENGITLLDEAVELGDLTLIADMLAYAKSCSEDILNECLRDTREKIALSKNKTTLMNLIGGAYLFDPELGERLKTAYTGESRLASISGTPPRDNSSPTFSLDDNDFEKIAEKMLGQADDNNLAFFIKNASTAKVLYNDIACYNTPEKWPHNDPAQWNRIHAEVTRRYVDENKKMPLKVWQALKERQQKHRRFEKLAHFYEDAITHVVEKYKEAPQQYADKARLLLGCLSQSADTPQELEAEAKSIANALVMPNSALATRGCSIFSLSKTQRLVKNAGDKVVASSEHAQTLQSDVPATGSNVTKTEIKAMLVSLEGGEKEQKVTRQRAALARAAFKNTLQYLEKQCGKKNPDPISLAKKEIMDGLIATYSSRKIECEEFFEKVEAQFAPPSSDGKATLMSKRGCWPFWPKSAKLLYKELNANKQILEACPVQ
ncbi:MAG: hypothetical protein KBD83_00905 [Gammaproteobacteria bacterium]|nr:hypothetical protein [Gammaproteobacteria bacterium]